MKKASERGLHRRFYANHRNELRRKKAEIGKEKRRQNPFFGIYKEIKSGDLEGIKSAIKKLSTIADDID